MKTNDNQIVVPEIGKNELDEIGLVEVCCEKCKQLIIKWSPSREFQLGKQFLINAVRNHKC